MTLEEFYALFPHWEEELHQVFQAQAELERALAAQAPRPEEVIHFRGHWELLLLLRGLLRLRPFLEGFAPTGGERTRARYEGIAQRLRERGHPQASVALVADFFRAWRQEPTRRSPSSLTPRGQAAVRPDGKGGNP